MPEPSGGLVTRIERWNGPAADELVMPTVPAHVEDVCQVDEGCECDMV
eukprot:COSAG01_NODE_18379_length_1079_cov_26.880612_1_plen_48_part_00